MVQYGKLYLQDCKLANHNQFPLKKQGASRTYWVLGAAGDRLGAGICLAASPHLVGAPPRVPKFEASGQRSGLPLI
jgi:hypothetical protein